MTGDLVSREKDVDQSKLDGMMEAIDHVMKPYDPSTLQIGVISVQVEKDIPKVKWTYSHNQPPYRRSAAQLAPMMFPRPRRQRRQRHPGEEQIHIRALLCELRRDDENLRGQIELEDKSTHTPRDVNCVGDASDKTCSQLCSN